ncbi:MAG: hypothetical protein V1835_03460 [Candidatus Micrarchaeota archaeon]
MAGNNAILIVAIIAILGVSLIVYSVSQMFAASSSPKPSPTIQNDVVRVSAIPEAIISTVAIGDEDSPPPLPPG